MSSQEEPTTVRYTVKELFARIDMKLDGLAAVLDAKADHAALVALEDRQEKSEVRLEELERSASYAKGVKSAAWAIVALLLTIAGLLIPIVLYVI